MVCPHQRDTSLDSSYLVALNDPPLCLQESIGILIDMPLYCIYLEKEVMNF